MRKGLGRHLAAPAPTSANAAAPASPSAAKRLSGLFSRSTRTASKETAAEEAAVVAHVVAPSSVSSTSVATVVGAGADKESESADPQAFEWTAEDCDILAHTLGVKPAEPAVQRFVFDAVSSFPLPAPWFPQRDSRDRVFFANIEENETKWQHPQHEVLEELVAICRECLGFSADRRQGRVQQLEQYWDEQAASEWSKWSAVDADGDKQYFYNSETKDSTWTNPEAAIHGQRHLRSHIRRLVDDTYLWRLKSAEQQYEKYLASEAAVASGEASVTQEQEDSASEPTGGAEQVPAASNIVEEDAAAPHLAAGVGDLHEDAVGQNRCPSSASSSSGLSSSSAHSSPVPLSRAAHHPPPGGDGDREEARFGGPFAATSLVPGASSQAAASVLAESEAQSQIAQSPAPAPAASSHATSASNRAGERATPSQRSAAAVPSNRSAAPVSSHRSTTGVPAPDSAASSHTPSASHRSEVEQSRTASSQRSAAAASSHRSAAPAPSHQFTPKSEDSGAEGAAPPWLVEGRSNSRSLDEVEHPTDGTSLGIQARDRTFGRNSGLPVDAWMQPEAYGQSLGLQLTEAVDSAILDVLRPIFLLALPVPWEVQRDGHKVLFAQCSMDPPDTSDRHPFHSLHVDMVKALRSTVSGGQLQPKKAKKQIAKFIQYLCGRASLSDFGIWEKIKSSSSNSFCSAVYAEVNTQRRCYDDPRIAAASRVGLALLATKLFWEGIVTDEPYPIAEEEIWDIADKLCVSVLQSRRRLSSGSEASGDHPAPTGSIAPSKAILSAAAAPAPPAPPPPPGRPPPRKDDSAGGPAGRVGPGGGARRAAGGEKEKEKLVEAAATAPAQGSSLSLPVGRNLQKPSGTGSLLTVDASAEALHRAESQLEAEMRQFALFRDAAFASEDRVRRETAVQVAAECEERQRQKSARLREDWNFEHNALREEMHRRLALQKAEADEAQHRSEAALRQEAVVALQRAEEADRRGHSQLAGVEQLAQQRAEALEVERRERFRSDELEQIAHQRAAEIAMREQYRVEEVEEFAQQRLDEAVSHAEELAQHAQRSALAELRIRQELSDEAELQSRCLAVERRRNEEAEQIAKQHVDELDAERRSRQELSEKFEEQVRLLAEERRRTEEAERMVQQRAGELEAERQELHAFERRRNQEVQVAAKQHAEDLQVEFREQRRIEEAEFVAQQRAEETARQERHQEEIQECSQRWADWKQDQTQFKQDQLRLMAELQQSGLDEIRRQLAVRKESVSPSGSSRFAGSSSYEKEAGAFSEGPSDVLMASCSTSASAAGRAAANIDDGSFEEEEPEHREAAGIRALTGLRKKQSPGRQRRGDRMRRKAPPAPGRAHDGLLVEEGRDLRSDIDALGAAAVSQRIKEEMLEVMKLHTAEVQASEESLRGRHCSEESMELQRTELREVEGKLELQGALHELELNKVREQLQGQHRVEMEEQREEASKASARADALKYEQFEFCFLRSEAAALQFEQVQEKTEPVAPGICRSFSLAVSGSEGHDASKPPTPRFDGGLLAICEQERRESCKLEGGLRAIYEQDVCLQAEWQAERRELKEEIWQQRAVLLLQEEASSNTAQAVELERHKLPGEEQRRQAEEEERREEPRRLEAAMEQQCTALQEEWQHERELSEAEMLEQRAALQEEAHAQHQRLEEDSLRQRALLEERVAETRQKMEHEVERERSEAMAMLQSQTELAELERRKDAAKASIELESAKRAEEAKLRESAVKIAELKHEEEAKALRLKEVREAEAKNLRLQQQRLEGELRKVREADIIRKEEDTRRQFEQRAESREFQWRLEHQELEWKSKVKQLEWQMDYDSATALESSLVPLTHSESHTSLRGRDAQRQRPRSAKHLSSRSARLRVQHLAYPPTVQDAARELANEPSADWSSLDMFATGVEVVRSVSSSSGFARGAPRPQSAGPLRQPIEAEAALRIDTMPPKQEGAQGKSSLRPGSAGSQQKKCSGDGESWKSAPFAQHVPPTLSFKDAAKVTEKRPAKFHEWQRAQHFAGDDQSLDRGEALAHFGQGNKTMNALDAGAGEHEPSVVTLDELHRAYPEASAILALSR